MPVLMITLIIYYYTLFWENGVLQLVSEQVVPSDH